MLRGLFARASVDATDGIVPGQQLRVIVEVFAPDFFTAPPEFPLFDIPNALVTFSADRAQNMVQTIDGQQYSGIRKVYAVVPEQAGTITVPSIEIPLGWSMDGKPTKGNIATAPFQLRRRPGNRRLLRRERTDNRTSLRQETDCIESR